MPRRLETQKESPIYVTVGLTQLDYRRLVTGLNRKENTRYRKNNGNPNKAAFVQMAIKKLMDEERY